MVQADEIYLEFRYKKARQIDFGNEQQYPIPMTMRAREKDGFKVVLPVLDLKHVHKIPLANEDPVVPDRADSYSDRQHEELCEEAYDAARAARKANDALRKKVYHHVKRGNIEIVNDPFARRAVKTDTNTMLKPSQIAAQIDGEGASDSEAGKTDEPESRDVTTDDKRKPEGKKSKK